MAQRGIEFCEFGRAEPLEPDVVVGDVGGAPPAVGFEDFGRIAHVDSLVIVTARHTGVDPTEDFASPRDIDRLVK